MGGDLADVGQLPDSFSRPNASAQSVASLTIAAGNNACGPENGDGGASWLGESATQTEFSFVNEIPSTANPLRGVQFAAGATL
jgi:hypothetical protein